MAFVCLQCYHCVEAVKNLGELMPASLSWQERDSNLRLLEHSCEVAKEADALPMWPQRPQDLAVIAGLWKIKLVFVQFYSVTQETFVLYSYNMMLYDNSL